VTARPAGLAGDPGDRAARDLATRAAGEWSGGESDGRGIVGVGIDAVDLDRFATVLARRPRLAVRLFSGAERAYAATAPDPVPRLAARFAAKEAVSKCFSTGIGAELGWRSVSIHHGARLQPLVRLDERGMLLLRASGGTHVLISLSHTDTSAVAVAALVRAGATG